MFSQTGFVFKSIRNVERIILLETPGNDLPTTGGVVTPGSDGVTFLQGNSKANTVTEEGTASGSYATTMLSNWSYGANGKLNTWYPTARTSANVQSANLTALRELALRRTADRVDRAARVELARPALDDAHDRLRLAGHGRDVARVRARSADRRLRGTAGRWTASS